MKSLTITRPVLVKVKVTEEYKKALVFELQKAINRLDLQLQQMDFQAKRMLSELEKQNPKEVPPARQRLEAEKQQYLSSKQKLLDKLKETGKLSPGEEVIYGQVESFIEVKVGDSWRQITGVEIILEDGKVIEIRQHE